MNTINQLIQNHSLAIVITTLVIYALVWLISRKSSNKQTPPSSKGKVTAYQGQVISLCVLIAIVSGLYWLWATCIRGKTFRPLMAEVCSMGACSRRATASAVEVRILQLDP